MPLISKTLRMNGQTITTPGQFFEYFSPGDFLRSKELAAYFAIRQLERLSPAHTYFSEMLNIAVTREKTICSQCRLPEGDCIQSACCIPAGEDWYVGECRLMDQLHQAQNLRIQFSGYWNYDRETGAPGWNALKNKALMVALEQDSFVQKVQQQTDAIALKTALPQKQKGVLALILSLGYLLAGKLPEECPITPAEAEAAYLGRVWSPEVTFRDTSGGRFYPARPEPYRLSLRKNTELLLGERITLRKIIAEPSPQGNTAMPVVLQLPDRQETIQPGDYRYASFVGDEMIRLYPVEKKNGDRTLIRRGNTLFLQDEMGNILREISCKDRDIVDMVPGPYKEEWIVLTPGHVDYRSFHTKTLPSRGIVELQMKGTTVYLLTEQGELRRHGDWTGMPRRTTMDGMTL